MKARKCATCCLIVCFSFAAFIYESINIHLFDSSISHILKSNAIQHVQGMITKYDINHLSNANNVKFIIGLGARKCGSVYFQTLFKQTINLILENNHSNTDIHLQIVNELHHWDTCILSHYISAPSVQKYSDVIDKAFKQIKKWEPSMDINDKTYSEHYKGKQKSCNFDQYLAKFDKYIDTPNTSNTKWILSEKSPEYFKYYHTAYALSFYGHIHDIWFYVLLRNPTKRTWSSYWMLEQKLYKKNDVKGIQSMAHKIQTDIDTFADVFPLYHDLLSIIKIKDKNQANNDDISEMQLITLYTKAVYDVFALFHVPSLIGGCYYPQIVMWHYTFNNIIVKDYKLNTSIKLQNRLKILQSETVFKDTSNVITKFMCWVLEHSKEKCQYTNQKIRDAPSDLFWQRHNSYAPSTSRMKSINLTIFSQLDIFYKDCNQRLYWFLQAHPQYLLLENWIQWNSIH